MKAPGSNTWRRSRRAPHDLDRLFARYLASRDPELLAELYERTSPYLLRRAVRISGDRMLAEDIVQDTFLGLIDGARSFEPGRPVLPYLTGIVARRARRAVSGQGTRPAAIDIGSDAGTPRHEIPDRIGVIEMTRRVLRSIRSLPEPYRGVVVLYLEHDLPPRSIGKRLGRDPKLVRVQVHRGLCMLRRELARHYDQRALAAFGCVALRHGPVHPPIGTRPRWLPARGLPTVLPKGLPKGLPKAMLAAIAVATLGILAWPNAEGPEALPPTTGEPATGSGAARRVVHPGAAGAADPATRTATVLADRRLEFVRPGGEPAPGVGVRLVKAGHDFDFGTCLRSASDEAGHVRLDGVPPGHYLLVTDRRAPQAIDIPRSTTWRHRVEIPRGVDVAGGVSDHDGRPARAAAIWLAPPGQDRMGQVVSCADDEGSRWNAARRSGAG